MASENTKVQINILTTMRLNFDLLKYLSKDEWRVLTAIEMGLRNHEVM